MNTPISFELAKLLKEKGFDEALTFYFDLQDSNKLKPIPMSDEINKFHSNRNSLMLSAPTIAEVVMWLYEKHGIWIVINPHKGEDDLGKPFMEFDPEVWSFTNTCILHNTKLLYFNSPIEAYEAAIEYVLNNLV